MKKKKFEQKSVNNFFERSRKSGNSMLEAMLENAKTESEKNRIKKLLKDFK